jgi:hypothetical protein
MNAEAMKQQQEQELPGSILHFNWDQRQAARAAMNTLVQALADDPVNNYFSGSKRVRFVKDEVGSSCGAMPAGSQASLQDTCRLYAFSLVKRFAAISWCPSKHVYAACHSWKRMSHCLFASALEVMHMQARLCNCTRMSLLCLLGPSLYTVLYTVLFENLTFPHCNCSRLLQVKGYLKALPGATHFLATHDSQAVALWQLMPHETPRNELLAGWTRILKVPPRLWRQLLRLELHYEKAHEEVRGQGV